MKISADTFVDEVNALIPRGRDWICRTTRTAMSPCGVMSCWNIFSMVYNLEDVISGDIAGMF